MTLCLGEEEVLLSVGCTSHGILELIYVIINFFTYNINFFFC